MTSEQVFLQGRSSKCLACNWLFPDLEGGGERRE